MIKGLRVVFTQEEKTEENVRKFLEATGVVMSGDEFECFLTSGNLVALLWRESVCGFYLSNKNEINGSEMTLIEAFHFIDELNRNERRDMEKDIIKDEEFSLGHGANHEDVKIDNVNPSHYTEMAISPHEYNKANDISWNEAQVIKYVSRWKNKNGKEDLLKAKWYLDDLIDNLV